MRNFQRPEIIGFIVKCSRVRQSFRCNPIYGVLNLAKMSELRKSKSIYGIYIFFVEHVEQASSFRHFYL